MKDVNGNELKLGDLVWCWLFESPQDKCLRVYDHYNYVYAIDTKSFGDDAILERVDSFLKAENTMLWHIVNYWEYKNLSTFDYENWLESSVGKRSVLENACGEAPLTSHVNINALKFGDKVYTKPGTEVIFIGRTQQRKYLVCPIGKWDEFCKIGDNRGKRNSPHYSVAEIFFEKPKRKLTLKQLEAIVGEPFEIIGGE